MPDKTDVMTPDINCVFIGKKPTKTYVFSVTTQAQKNHEIKIRARGNAISKAVDVAEIALNRFLKGWKKSSVITGTQEKETEEKDEDGKPRIDKVSFIEITIKKGK